ncbi:hypothetical protein CMV_015703 [Castanea mollissima]|uniref:Uncharacterized protein n=1 Tax=Castanea mollissima TaxID=60419 RepID=A0A8J4QVV8_9ROSI|nr:hypothetical protein CMV_015703 [Castanea mollissima]
MLSTAGRRSVDTATSRVATEAKEEDQVEDLEEEVLSIVVGHLMFLNHGSIKEFASRVEIRHVAFNSIYR